MLSKGQLDEEKQTRKERERNNKEKAAQTRDYQPHFPREKTEPQRSEVTLKWSHSWERADPQADVGGLALESAPLRPPSPTAPAALAP